MSHRTTETKSENLQFIHEFDPEYHKELRKQKTLWFAATIVLMVAWGVAQFGTITSGIIVSLAVAVLVGGVLFVALKAGKAKGAFDPVDANKKIVVRANQLADGWDEQLDQSNTAFKVKIHPIDATEKRRVITVDYEDPMFASLVFEVGQTYVGTRLGPNIASIIDALEGALVASPKYVENTKTIVNFARKVDVPVVTEQQRSAIELVGD